jgi:hypothetical protein
MANRSKKWHSNLAGTLGVLQVRSCLTPFCHSVIRRASMNLRTIETTFAWFTLAATAIYIPVETWASLPYGLLNPFYLVDVIAMVLLVAGAIHSLRARPRSAPGILCAACAWAAANGWRATFGRLTEVWSGASLDFGIGELWAVGIATAVALVCLGVSLLLVVQAERRGD